MVSFPGNKLHTLTCDTFIDLKNVLEFNKIRTVGSKLLSPMTKLDVVFFGSNDCINASYSGPALINDLKIAVICFDDT